MILNIIGLIFEVLYYSLFMKFARPEGKLWRYILLFTIVTILILFIGTSNIYSYLMFVILALYGLKYVVKLNISLYDMLILLIMLLFKLIIETPVYMILLQFINNNFILTLPSSIIKICLLITLKNNMNCLYIKLKNKWDNNDFYIRYIFSTILFLFVIFSLIFLIIKLGGE